LIRESVSPAVLSDMLPLLRNASRILRSSSRIRFCSERFIFVKMAALGSLGNVIVEGAHGKEGRLMSFIFAQKT
jgi:hypothetical protein